MKNIVQLVQNLLKPYIDRKDRATQANIAPVEADATSASKAYSVGAQLILSDVLYDVTAPIAQNDALTVGTNIVVADDITTQIKNHTVTTDALPTQNSTNPVQSGGVYTSEQNIYSVMGKNGAKNKEPFDIEVVKALNTTGTWTGNSYELNGITFAFADDGKVTVSGTASALCSINISGNYDLNGDYIITGCPSGGGGSTYSLRVYDSSATVVADDVGEGISFTANNLANCRTNLIVRKDAAISTPIVFAPMIRDSKDTDPTYQPHAETNVELTGKVSSLNSAITNVNTRVNKLVESVCYGFHIDGNESNPSDMVTYLADAVGMTPAKMDYANSKFDYGSWEDAFFMPKPCMLKSDGTVDYYLDPDDYSKKVDGTTASDVSNTSYDGNAMMEWGQNGKKIWLKIVPKDGGKSADVFIANAQLDDNYHDWSFHNCDGVSADHFYTPIYNGSVISSKMRSLSGQQVSKTLDGTAEITAAKANNASAKELWNIECVADRFLINMLLILMGKSTDTQTVFGQGANTSGSEAINDTFRTGVHDAKGLFWGTNSGTVSSNNFANVVKVFGMENYWGFQWRRTNGYILADGTQKVKLTYGKEDGSNVVGYNTDGADYISISGATPTGTSGNYISEMKFAEQGMFGKDTSGTSSTYYCDAQWYNNSGSRLALFGGSSVGGAGVGAFCCGLYGAVSSASWNIGAELSCKPLA